MTDRIKSITATSTVGTRMARPLHRRTHQLPALTPLRFLAAIYVVLFHLRGAAAVSSIDAFTRLGYVGVTFFFILSGFILAYTYWDSDFQEQDVKKNFFIARFARLYPLYFFSIIFERWAWYLLQPDYGKPDHASLFFDLLGLQAWGPLVSFNGVTWSISNEEFFYYMFPFSLTFIKKISFKTIVAYTALGVTLLVGINALWDMIAHGVTISCFDERKADIAGLLHLCQVKKYLPLIHCGEFLSGIILLRLWRRMHQPISRLGIWLLTIVSMCTGILLVIFQNRIPETFFIMGLSNLVWVPLILACASVQKGLLTHPVLKFLGEASYGIYLFHFILLRLFVHYFPQIYNPTANYYLGFVFLILPTLALASLTHVFIEKPARRWILRTFIPAFSDGTGSP